MQSPRCRCPVVGAFSPPTLFVCLALVLVLIAVVLPQRVASAFADEFNDAYAPPREASRPLAEVDYLDWGLLSLGSHAPLFQPRLRYTAGRVDVLAANEVEAVLSFSVTNAWGQRSHYRIDGEFARFELNTFLGLGNRFELGLQLTLAGRHGGFLDDFIMGFHDAFGITQARRDQYPRDELRIEIDYERDGEFDIILGDDNEGWGVPSPVLTLKHELISQLRWRPALSVELGVKLPFGDTAGQFATPGWAVMLHLGLRQPITVVDWLQLYVVGGFLYSPAHSRTLGFPTKELQGSLVLGPEFRIASNATVVLYWMHQTGAGRGSEFSPQEKTTNEFLLGLLWAPTGRDDWVVEIGLIENTFNDANGPDFGFHLALRARFR